MKSRFTNSRKQFFSLLASTLFCFGVSAQIQKGLDINGEVNNDFSGNAVSMPDENTIAIGAYLNDGNGFNSGHVRVYIWNGSAWVQKGDDINGEASNDDSGFSVSMPDANTVAIGARNNNGSGTSQGHVRIYSWSGTAWVQKGLDINGEANNDFSGWSVSMPDANTVAIGAPNNDGAALDAGHVRVYTWSGTAWVQKGSDIDAEASGDNFGYSVSMPDANTVAIGARMNDGNGANAGQLRIYEWSGTSWVQKGLDIDGEASNDYFGHSVSMSDANTVAAGAPFNDGNGADAGHVRVYTWSGSAWVQKGTDINGELTNDNSGWSISLIDANTLAIGAQYNDGNGSNSGHVRIYKWNGTAWIQKGIDINGEAMDDWSGYSISMPDANTVGIGAVNNSGGGSLRGHARVYSLCLNTTSSIFPVTCNASYVSPSGNYTYTTSGTYSDTLPNAGGCDSIITIHLTINTIADQSVTASTSVFCDNGSTNINIGSSQTGVNYFLRENITDTIVAGPIAGNGSSIALNTGTISSTTTYNVLAVKPNDYALEFSAPFLQRAEITSPFTTYGSTMTVEAWVYLANPTNSFPWMGQSQPGADNMSSNVWIWHALGVGNEFTWYVNDNGTWRWVNSTTLTGATGWHHIATVADASSIRIYVDGVLDATGPGIASGIRNSSLSAIHVGNDPRFPFNVGYHGSFVVSDFRLWNIARTQPEISTTMNSCLIGNENGLKHYNKFNTNTGTIAYATTGSNATLSASMNPATDWVIGNELCEPNCTFEMSQLATVTINHSNTGTDVRTECDSYTWIDGNTYTSSTTTPTHALTNAAGCDSTVTLNLTIINSTGSTDVRTECDSYTWIDGNTYTSSTTTPTHVVTNAAGCDSTITLNLTINNSNGSTDVQTACDSYLWIDGNTYSSSTTTPTFTLLNVNGCDSVITLNLTINSLPDVTTSTSGVSITANLSGATYQWIDCDNSNLPISGATNQSYTATANGNYAVVINNGTCVDTSSCNSITTVGITDLIFQHVKIYPNPSDGLLNIELPVYDDALYYTITTADGKLVRQEPLSGTHSTIDLSDVSKGFYMLYLRNEKDKFMFKLSVK